MKKQASLLLILFATVLLTSFKRDYKNVGLYKIDHTKSGVTWIGKKVMGGHNGTIDIKEGTVNYNGQTITSGTFTVDMSTIKALDLEGDKRSKLENHLKSPDFFDVAKYPITTFKIKRVEKGSGDKATAVGSLTIKATTKEISFPVTINAKGGRLEVTASNIKIDRTQYGVMYASKSLKSTLGDKAIDDEFTISFSLVLLQTK